MLGYLEGCLRLIRRCSPDSEIAGSPWCACTHVDAWSIRAAGVLGALRGSPPCTSSPPAEWRRQSLPVSFIVSGGCLWCLRRLGLSCRARSPHPAGECMRAGKTLSGCGLQSLWRCSVHISRNQTASIYTLPRVQLVAVCSSLQQRPLSCFFLTWSYLWKGLVAPKCTCALSVSPQRPPEKCRYAVGSVLCEGEEKPDEELQKMYEKFGFKVFSLPEVSHAITTTFPCTTLLSYVLGSYRVYPKLGSYIEVRRHTGFPLPGARSTLTLDEASCPPGAGFLRTELWKFLMFTHFGHHAAWIISHVCEFIHAETWTSVHVFILASSGEKNHSHISANFLFGFAGDFALARFMWD